MIGLPSAIYFPYIDLDNKVLKELLALFRHIRLLQPVFCVPFSLTEEAVKRDWVRIDRPLSVDMGEKEAKRLLKDYERLGHLHHDSGYLAYLKHGGARRLEEEPGYELLKEIRQYGSTSPTDDDEALRGQILLQMAQDLDTQRREIKEALEAVHLRERELRREIERGLEDEEVLKWEIERLPSPERDDFLIPQRLRAWGEMLLALNEKPSPVLLTDNHAAISHLLETCAENLGEMYGSPTVFLQVQLPLLSSGSLEMVERIRQTAEGLLPWRIFCERVEKLLSEALTSSWSKDSLRDILTVGRALSSYFHDEVLETLMERVAALDPPLREGWRQGTLKAILFPENTLENLLSAGKIRPHENYHTLTLYLDDHLSGNASHALDYQEYKGVDD